MTATLPPFEPAILGKLKLKNRILKAATFEGTTPNRKPSPSLHQFHQAIAEGGIDLTTKSHCATKPDGRVKESMMWLHEDQDGIRCVLIEGRAVL